MLADAGVNNFAVHGDIWGGARRTTLFPAIPINFHPILRRRSMAAPVNTSPRIGPAQGAQRSPVAMPSRNEDRKDNRFAFGSSADC